MNRIDFKSILNINNVLLLAFYVLVLLGFLSFETSLILKILMIFLAALALFVFIKYAESQFVAILIYYLLSYDCSILYFSFRFPLWAIMILIAIFSSAGLYLSVNADKIDIDGKVLKMYAVLFSLVTLEIFLSLVPWPTDPKTKSAIIATLFYLFYGFMVLQSKNELNIRRISPYLIISSLIMTCVIVTSSWYSY